MDQTSGNSIASDREPVYTLGIASKLSEISVHSIRQHIDNGLIIPRTTYYKTASLFSSGYKSTEVYKETIINNGLKFCWDKSLVFTNPMLVNSSMFS